MMDRGSQYWAEQNSGAGLSKTGSGRLEVRGGPETPAPHIVSPFTIQVVFKIATY